MKVKINKVGMGALRVTIPKKIADTLGLRAGDILDANIRAKRLTFYKVVEK